MSQVLHILIKPEYVDRLIQVAEENGSQGSTILKARGIGKEESKTFLSIKKEEQMQLVIMVVPTEKVKTLSAAIENHFDFTKTGIGLIFAVPAHSTKGIQNKPSSLYEEDKA